MLKLADRAPANPAEPRPVTPFDDLPAFGLAGATAGVAAALVDAGGAGSAFALVGALGLHGFVGLALGVLLGLVHPALPAPLTPARLARATRRALWPRPEDALHRRARAVASIWIAALLLRFVLPAASVAYGGVLVRVRSSVFTGLATALVGIVVALVGLALAAPARAALTRALEFAVRRWPRLGPGVTVPLPHLAWALIWLAASVRGWVGRADAAQITWALRGGGAVLGGVLVLGVAGALLPRVIRGLRPAVGVVFVLGLAVLALAGLATGLSDDDGRAALAAHAPLSGLVARLGGE